MTSEQKGENWTECYEMEEIWVLTVHILQTEKGKGVKTFQNSVDVIYGSPLKGSTAPPPPWCRAFRGWRALVQFCTESGFFQSGGMRSLSNFDLFIHKLWQIYSAFLVAWFDYGILYEYGCAWSCLGLPWGVQTTSLEFLALWFMIHVYSLGWQLVPKVL